MRANSILLVMLSLSIYSGCSSAEKKDSPEYKAQQQVLLKARQDGEIKTAHEKMLAGNYDQAIQVYEEFKKKNPLSIFVQSADFGIAQSRELKGEWVEAIQLYKNVIAVNTNAQPELAALSLYRLSFCYEALGKDQQVIATLLDARLRASSLEPAIANAAVPARLAAAYFRSGREEDAVLELQRAQSGINSLISKNQSKVDKNWLAEIYIEMGYYSTNQLSASNFLSTAKTLRSVQGFLLQAMELNVEPHSEMAAKFLRENYRDLWAQVLKSPFDSKADEVVAARQQAQAQSTIVVEILQLIVDLKQRRPMSADENHPVLNDFFSYIDEIEKRSTLFLASRSEINRLTPEAIQRRAIKASGLVNASEYLPEEVQGKSNGKNSPEPKAKEMPNGEFEHGSKKEDPNL
jgi:tetratricopeptide (TPR) repeat protein